MNKLDVEIIINNHISLNSRNSLISLIESYLRANNIGPNSVITTFNQEGHNILFNDVRAIIIDEIPGYNKVYVDFTEFEINWFIYSLDERGPINHIEEDDDGTLNMSTHLMLPSIELFNLWENLFYDGDLKKQLLMYARTMLNFSDKGVDENIISCNRVILLHGPPGTGKTSLCKALAQKLTIQLQHRYNSGILIEINSHSLFSKWFSESGKLVSKMFSKIKQIVANPNLLVCVLIDEVESLAHARNQCLSGNEPSDSIRVVNALLTQIDQIRRLPNVLLFATSNITESIDIAFIDRADIKQFLGLPSIAAIYKVYYSCIKELIKAKIINSDVLLDSPEMVFRNGTLQFAQCNNKLIEICQISAGFSGRSLRKIPFIAYALYLSGKNCSLDEFLLAMLKAIQREEKERKLFESNN